MMRRPWWLVATLVVVACVAAIVAWRVFLTPSLEVSQLRSGEAVSLRSGLSYTVPPQASATFSRWRPPNSSDLGLVDDVLFKVEGARHIGALTYWTEGAQSGPLAMVKRGTQIASQSADGSVEVRWRRPTQGDFNVFVVTRLPGSHPGLLQIVDPEARDAASAWRSASTTWRLLNASGTDLPASPQ
jgi:hypothetical protein